MYKQTFSLTIVKLLARTTKIFSDTTEQTCLIIVLLYNSAKQICTTALNDFIDHYKNDNKLNAAVTLLGMNEWFVKLEESNIAFNDLYIMRVKENAGKPDLNLKELRKESAIQYRKLVKHLEAGNIINPSDLYNKVLKEINQLIDKYNSIRRKHKSGDDEPEE